MPKQPPRNENDDERRRGLPSDAPAGRPRPDRSGPVGKILIPVVVLVIGAILFYSWDVLVPPPDLGGNWHCLTHTTTKGNYEGVLLIYDTGLVQRPGGVLKGDDQKTDEISSADKIVYPRGQRSLGDIEGTLSRRYIMRSRIDLSIAETSPAGLQSRRTYTMRVVGKRMVGEFSSTVASQQGLVLCRRLPFDATGHDAWERLRTKVEGAP